MVGKTARLVLALSATLCAALGAAAPARADLELAPALAAPLCAGVTSFCGDFALPGFGRWDGLNGNTEPGALARYFQVLPGGPGLPVASGYFRSTVDGGAVEQDEAGQRALVYLFPGPRPQSRKTGAFEGSERWYHTTIAFPGDFRPSPATEWNWVVQWHNWPDGPCCANLALTVDTSRRGRNRLSLRVMGGGDPRHPAERYSSNLRNPRARTRWFRDDRPLRLGHWYDLLIRVRWSHSARRGLVQWWLDGRLLASVRTPTLFWYRNDGQGRSGPGQAYWMLGYYRPAQRRRGVDRRVASVLYNGARIGPTHASVAF